MYNLYYSSDLAQPLIPKSGFSLLQETSKLRAGKHGFSDPVPSNQSCGRRPPHYGSRGKVERKISSSPADHTRVPYSHQHHHYNHQRHTGQPRAPQHNAPLHPLEDKDSWNHYHKQSTVRDKLLSHFYFSMLFYTY